MEKMLAYSGVTSGLQTVPLSEPLSHSLWNAVIKVNFQGSLYGHFRRGFSPSLGFGSEEYSTGNEH